MSSESGIKPIAITKSIKLVDSVHIKPLQHCRLECVSGGNPSRSLRTCRVACLVERAAIKWVETEPTHDIAKNKSNGQAWLPKVERQ